MVSRRSRAWRWSCLNWDPRRGTEGQLGKMCRRQAVLLDFSYNDPDTDVNRLDVCMENNLLAYLFFQKSTFVLLLQWFVCFYFFIFVIWWWTENKSFWHFIFVLLSLNNTDYSWWRTADWCMLIGDYSDNSCLNRSFVECYVKTQRKAACSAKKKCTVLTSANSNFSHLMSPLTKCKHASQHTQSQNSNLLFIA